MRVSRRRGRVRLQFTPDESLVLSGLFDEIALAVETDVLPEDDPVRRRLFPAAYPDDAEADDEYRSLTETGLRTERAERARACAEQIKANDDVTMDDDDADRWIKALNDLRLALGTRLDITEEAPDPDPSDPDLQERLAYYWLTALQDSLVRALMA